MGGPAAFQTDFGPFYLLEMIAAEESDSTANTQCWLSKHKKTRARSKRQTLRSAGEEKKKRKANVKDAGVRKQSASVDPVGGRWGGGGFEGATGISRDTLLST